MLCVDRSGFPSLPCRSALPLNLAFPACLKNTLNPKLFIARRAVHILPRKEGDFEKNDEVYDAIDEASKSLSR